MKLPYHLKEFLSDESGATVLEYAFILLLIALVCIGGFTAVGNAVDTGLTNASNHLPG